MRKAEILLIGAGGHALACIDVIEQTGLYSIAGLVGLPHEKGQQLNYCLIGQDNDLPELARHIHLALISVGQIRTAAPRIQLFQAAQSAGFSLPAIIAPSAYVSPHAQLGAGSIVMHGAIINAGAHVGENCIINSRALIEHDSCIGHHCHIATGAIINGAVRVGKGSFIGSGAVIRQGLHIGEHCLIGMGVALRHNLDNDVCYIG